MISFITICYNAEKDIAKTLESVLDQTYSDFEYIIIDGNSKDKTLEIVNKYKNKFIEKGIPLTIKSEPDKGVYDAMNKGIDIAQGEWINFINAGDCFYSENCIDLFFQKEIASDIDYCYGDTIEVYHFGEILLSQNKQLKKNIIMPFCHQSVFVRTNLLKQYKFNSKYKILGDHDLFYRLKKDGRKSEFRPVVISKYDATQGLSANNPLALHLERLQIYHINNKWYYPFAIIYVYMRQGLIQPLKNILPRNIVNYIMAYRRK